ncbi:GNAT family N-acetyltransferase [Streptomyces sp. NPDC059627]
MPPTDASAGAGPVPVHPGPTGHPGRPGPAEDIGDCEDTLDLRLPDELLALIAGKTPDTDERAPGPTHHRLGPPEVPDKLDLLDQVSTWGPTETPVGLFHLAPVHVERDLPIISGWMNDPAVAAFWQLAESRAQTEDHLRAQLAGDGRSVPCLGMLDGVPMSYWEIYRADLDPLARRYPARPHDTGVHLLVGNVADRGRGLGSALLRAVADLVFERRPACARVVAEPDLHNTPSVAAFLNAGFRYAAEVDLPGKRAALMIRDRSLRHLM